MTTIYFAGGEDETFYQVGGALVSTNAATFRNAYARCSLGTGTSAAQWVPWQQFSSAVSSFWSSSREYVAAPTTISGQKLNAWLDSSGVERLRIVGTGTNNLFRVEKVDATPTATQLGSNFTMIFSAGAVIDKLDVFINYAAMGTFTVYLNGVQQFTYSGDVTTNSATALASFRVGNHNGAGIFFSEIIVADTDTRSYNLQTLAPVANGNTHSFDTGSPAAANVNEITLNDSTLDGSTTANQVDQYTIPSIASGTFTILGIVVAARLQKGASGPSKMDLGVRSTSDYWSSDQVLTTAWVGYQNVWNADPHTSSTWGALPSNIGIKSIT